MLVIQIQDLTKIYRSAAGAVTALDHVNLRVRKGEIYGIIGYSGAGKSTLLGAIAGLYKVKHGQIILGSSDISNLHAHVVVKSGISLVPERREVFDSLTVMD
ncbi:MAG: ATP-binding cassette domain-containing protein, partial [Alicyclobacillus sp.]|nr:ATP-binding cassette domain-containing protein [Alicyclobacillus sp.]